MNPDISPLLERLLHTRQTTAHLVEPLGAEDTNMQSMPSVSPPKWHLAHTTWFFEVFILKAFVPSYVPYNDAYAYLFNSYYEGEGPRQPRHQRGILSRPSLEEVMEYRKAIDGRVIEAVDMVHRDKRQELLDRILLGIHHEEQHQELLLMDIKHIFYTSLRQPAYQNAVALHGSDDSSPLSWIPFDGELHWVGAQDGVFAFDNERPSHRVWAEPFQIANRLVTSGEFVAFIEDGGYTRPELWLSDGWDWVQKEGHQAPLYWDRTAGDWSCFTLGGPRPLRASEPVCHVSFYEADAFARWSHKRLPTEFEWEIAAKKVDLNGPMLESKTLHPVAAPRGSGLKQMFGDVWEWTQSAYMPYAGFKPLGGVLAEYNAKFMCNQMVQRGSSCLTPQTHARRTYRNFYYPHQRWNMQGFRLANS